MRPNCVLCHAKLIPWLECFHINSALSLLNRMPVPVELHMHLRTVMVLLSSTSYSVIFWHLYFLCTTYDLFFSSQRLWTCLLRIWSRKESPASKENLSRTRTRNKHAQHSCCVLLLYRRCHLPPSLKNFFALIISSVDSVQQSRWGGGWDVQIELDVRCGICSIRYTRLLASLRRLKQCCWRFLHCCTWTTCMQTHANSMIRDSKLPSRSSWRSCYNNK